MSPFVPPRPKPHQGTLSLLGRVLFARRDNLGFLRERNYFMKMASYRIPGLDLFVVNEPTLARSILIGEWERFPKAGLLRKALHPAIGSGVLGSVGEEWKRQRRMIDPALDQRGVEELFPLMQAATDAMLARLAALPPRADVDIDVEMTHVTADAICRAICSVPFERDDAAHLFDAFTRYQAAALPFGLMRLLHLPPLLTPTGWRMRRATRDVRRLVEDLARPRYEADRAGRPDEGRDILGSLITARDPETEATFSFDELVDHLIVLFIAGHETTAGGLSWALYSLAHCAEVQERVAREVAEAAGTRPLQYDDIRKLKLTRDVFREALRLYPPVAYIVREATESAEFRGKPVPPGATVVVSPWLMQRHRDLWERPDEFDPDRFATESAKASLKKAYLPFSLGPRGCPGASFAMLEATLVIATLIGRYQLLPVPGHTPEPASRLTVRSRNGIKLRLEPRRAQC
jgi:cytochrome P450